MTTRPTLRLERLTRETFTPFGDVIALEGARHFPINGGTTERFHDLATIDVCDGGGRPLISVFRAQPRALPIAITMMERHPLGSQAFIPLAAVSRYVVVVAPAGTFRPERMRALLVEGWQGVNYAKGVWHHPLLALDAVSDFVVVDRGGTQPNCEETALDTVWQLVFPEMYASAV